MPIPVFDKNNLLLYIEITEIFSVHKNKERQIIVTTGQGEYFMPTTIEQISYLMSDYDFAQVNPNCVVNLGRVKSYVKARATVNGHSFVVTRRRRKEFEEKLILYRTRNTNG